MKLYYRSKSMTYELEVSPTELESQTNVPKSVWRQLDLKIADALKREEIGSFVIRNAKASALWRLSRRTLRDTPADSAGQKITADAIRLIVAECAPRLDGISFTLRPMGLFDGRIGTLKIDRNMDVVANWLPEWLHVFVMSRLGVLHRFAEPLAASVYNAWLLASSRDGEVELPIWTESSLSLSSVYPFPGGELLVDHETGHASLRLSSKISNRRVDESRVLDLLARVSRVLAQRSGRKVIVMSKAVSQALAAINYHLRVITADQPLVIPAILSLPSDFSPLGLTGGALTLSNDSHTEPREVELEADDSPAVEIQPSRDLMQVRCKRLGRRKRRDWNMAQLLTAMRRKGVEFGVDMNACEDVIHRLAADVNEFDIIVASGTQPVAGSGYELVRDPGRRQSDANIINLFRRDYFKAGEIAATVVYSVPGADGKDVFGRKIAQPAMNDHGYICGEALLESPRGTFVAQSSGKLVQKDRTLSIEPLKTYEGDVKTSIGVLQSNENLEIKGSIESGAIVMVTGDLVVRGDVRGVLVKVSGNLIVEGGIRLANRGLLSVGGNVSASYIEESKVVCRGSVAVTRAIVASSIFAHGPVTVTDKENGGVFGGRIVSAGSVETGNLGRSTSPVTTIEIGADVKSTLRTAVKRDRLKNVFARLEKDRAELKYLKSKTPAQRNPRHAETEAALQERIEREDKVCAALSKAMESNQDGLRLNGDAILTVQKVLSANCKVIIANKTIPIAADFEGAKVSGTLSHGSNISSIKEKPEEKSPA